MLRAMSMSGKSLIWVMSLLMAGSITVALQGWAAEHPGLPEMQTVNTNAEKATPAHPISLGDLRAFNVFDLEKSSFASEREGVPAEVIEYTRSALQASNLLRYDPASPGMLKFQCQDSGCHRIKTELTYGEDGPVLWRTSTLYKSCPLMNFHFQPDSKAFTNKVLARLTRDYQKALKAMPAKIEIHEE